MPLHINHHIEHAALYTIHATTQLKPTQKHRQQAVQLVLSVGDSYTVGFANTGGTTMCNPTACNPVTGFCNPELDSQNAAIAWGPLAASHFTADFEVIAWSGAEVVTPSNTDSLVANGTSFETAIELYPLDSQIWTRQVAADNMSMVANYSSWVPQVAIVPNHPKCTL